MRRASILPEVPEPFTGKLGVPNGVLDVLVPEVVLQGVSWPSLASLKPRAVMHFSSDSRQRQRLSFIRRGWSDPSAAEKINDLQGLAGFGAKPFRLAKLTACRKVRYECPLGRLLS